MFKTIIEFLKRVFSKKEKQYGKGWVKDPIDFRDIKLSSIIPEKIMIPEEYNVPFRMKIKNQGNSPSCVGQTCATIKEYLEQKEQNNIEFDGFWIYEKCKEIDNYDGVGTYFRVGLKVLKDIGAKPINGKEEDAIKYRIGGYAKVNVNFTKLKEAIYKYGAILVGFYGNNEGWQSAYIKPPRLPDWGHAVSLAVGYNKDYIFIQNSWGKDRGDNGYFYFDKNYLPESAWCVLVDLPNDWQKLLGKDKEKPKYFFENNLWKGLKNDEVKILQDTLKYLGCFNPEIDSTGYYGSVTSDAVKCYQIRKNIKPVSGYFGILTRTAINKDLNTTEKL